MLTLRGTDIVRSYIARDYLMRMPGPERLLPARGHGRARRWAGLQRRPGGGRGEEPEGRGHDIYIYTTVNITL